MNGFRKWLGYIITLAVLTLIILGLGYVKDIKQTEAGQASTGRGKKVVVLVLDAVTWDDINSAKMPNLKKIINHGYVGLMNAKTRGMNKDNSESGYLTIGVGMRVNAPKSAGTYVITNQQGEIKVREIDIIKSLVKKDLPNYRAGQLGYTAKSLGLKVALVGNADSADRDRQLALAAMDDNGIVPKGYISNELLQKDNNFPGKVRTNEAVLFGKVKSLLPGTDILFVDYGDTARIDRQYETINNVFKERNLALSRADAFLGRLDQVIDWQNTMLMVVVPNASQTSIEKGNTSLTPIVVKTSGSQSGFLISNTTRREGVVANIDIAPTIFNYLTGQKGDFLGEPMTYRTSENPSANDNINQIQRKLDKFYNLRWSRFIAHGLCVILIVLSLAFSFIPAIANYFKVTEELRRKVVSLTFTYIMTLFTIGALLPFRHFIIESATIFITAVVLNLVLYYLLPKTEHVLAFTSTVTSLAILSYLYFAPSFLLNSPLGFDEIFLGGRYYGINNDAMGILVGASLISVFLAFQWSHLNRGLKVVLAVLYTGLGAYAMTPKLGANVGGTIAGLTAVVLLIMALSMKKKISWYYLVPVLVVVFGIEVGISYLDAMFNTDQTHAGRAIQALISTGFAQKFIELLISKLSLFLLITAIPPYNIMLLSEIIVFYRIIKGKDVNTASFKNVYPILYKGMRVFLFTALVAFFFNDTGVIAGTFICAYYLLPYSVLSK